MRRRLLGLIAALGALAALAALAACTAAPDRGESRSEAVTASPSPSPSPSASPSRSPSPSPSPKPLLQLPRGGRQLFPQFRVVAYYGSAYGPALGVLGRADPDTSAARLVRAAAAFARPGRPVLPTFELIATVANGFPTPRGTYSTPMSDRDIGRYLAAARRHKLLMVLDVQPGRAEFLPEVRRYERWLREPDVGLALDPEWKMGPGERPGGQIGHTDAATVNAVSAFVAGIVAKYRLPQKLFIVHQFRDEMIVHREQIVTRPGLATVFHIDGFGSQGAKLRVYAALHVRPPLANGFKLFYLADHAMMSPAQALSLVPAPDLISYQ